MSRIPPKNPEVSVETLRLRQANADADALLCKVLEDLHTVLRDECLREETPTEVWLPLESAVETIGVILQRLGATGPDETAQIGLTADRPTRRQGQFLAYIGEYMKRSPSGLAPTHAILQRFFGILHCPTKVLYTFCRAHPSELAHRCDTSASSPNGSGCDAPRPRIKHCLTTARKCKPRNDGCRFFDLTPPSANSMLTRLEQRGFIRRTPGVARAIQLSIDPDLIPPLEQPFKF